MCATLERNRGGSSASRRERRGGMEEPIRPKGRWDLVRLCQARARKVAKSALRVLRI